MRSVCVFCGSNTGSTESYAEAARELARVMVKRGLKLIYGGGGIGLMGVLGDAAMAAGGHVIGVSPRRLAEKELTHRQLTELHIVETMHERKSRMAELADGFIALPGGYGTLDEIFEMLTLTQLGLQRKPVALLDVDGFYSGLTAFLDHVAEQRFVRPEHRAMLMVGREPEALLDRMAAQSLPEVNKWVNP